MSFVEFLRASRNRYTSFAAIVFGSESLRNDGGVLYSI
jgi:hypothetical protein